MKISKKCQFRIILTGYLGGPNIGDEAIALSIIKGINNSFKNIDLIVISGNPVETKRMFGFLKQDVKIIKGIYPGDAISIREFIDLLANIKNASKVIFVGGGIIQDVHALSILKHCAYIVSLAGIFKIPSCLIGVGIGPIKSKSGLKLASYILKSISYTTVRDSHSKIIAERILGCKYSGINKSFDSALLLDPINIDYKKNTIGICLRKWNALRPYMLVDLLYEIKKTGKNCILLSYEKADNNFYKENLLDKINLDLPIIYPKTIKEARKIISELDGLISMRLHANLFAYIENTPFVALSYDPKITLVLHGIGAKKQVLPLNADAKQIISNLFDFKNVSLKEKNIYKNRVREDLLKALKITNLAYSSPHLIIHLWYAFLITAEKVIIKLMLKNIKFMVKKVVKN